MSCARCRAVSKENWTIFKHLPGNSPLIQRTLSVLVEDEGIEDVNFILKSSRRLPWFLIEADCSIKCIEESYDQTTNEALLLTTQILQSQKEFI